MRQERLQQEFPFPMRLQKWQDQVLKNEGSLLRDLQQDPLLNREKLAQLRPRQLSRRLQHSQIPFRISQEKEALHSQEP